MAQAQDTLNEGDAWKRKYYDSLEAFDRKEKQWSEVEDLLRRSLSRLTLAADGLDDTLDRQLKQLRNSIRDRAENAVLRPQIEAMSATLVKLDRQRSQQADEPHPGAILEQVLNTLNLPKGTGRKLKQLRKQLAKTDTNTPLQPLINAFSELITHALNLASAETASDTSPQASPGEPANEGGLLQRLFKKPAGESKKADTEPTATAPADTLEPARELLLHLSNAVAKSSAHADEYNLPARVKKCSSEHELMRLGDDLLGLLQTPALEEATAPEKLTTQGQTGSPIKPEAYDSAKDTEQPSTQEILLQLLERLHLPDEFTERVDALKDQLDKSGPLDSWSSVLEDIVALVSDMRTRIQEEKKELEKFLLQLTDQLQEVDATIQGTESVRAASRASGLELGAVVEEQVRGIESTVRDASELDQLKSTVQQRLDAILDHMNEHQREEDQRHREVEAEVEQLTTRLHSMERETSELRDRVRKERQHALTDALTKVPNRLAYEERMEQEVARWKRFDTPLHILVWDVDRFKRINDNYGHKAGDKVLTTIARLLSEQIRETDFFARYGGEEFVLIMTGAETEQVEQVADKLRQSVAECGFHFRGDAVQVTISCGISTFSENDTPESVFECADQALYRAKENGRNRIEIDCAEHTLKQNG